VIHWTKISGNSSTESNGTEIFKKDRFENFGQPLEIVLFPGNLEILESLCSIRHSISKFGQTLGHSPSRDCRVKMVAGQVFIDISVASVLSSDDLPFF